MKRDVLTQAQARKIILYAAGLSKRAQFGRGQEAVYKLIDHLGFLQIDTNYVVERAHHHSVAARVPNYELSWLEELRAEGRIFEFWTFATGYIPIRDFRYSLPVKASFLAQRKPVTAAETNLMNKVINRISREGPLMARDFENDRVKKSLGWWDWRPSKVALERLLLEGKLMTSRQGNFQKVYDLTENMISADVDMTLPTEQEFAHHIIKRSLKALGIASTKEICYHARFVDHSVKEELLRLTDAGQISIVNVDGVKTNPLYTLPEYLKKKITLAGDAFILSPFDILNIHRQRLKDFFNFDYQVECFVPKPKRKYGYFSLPILIGDTFVARMDSKADRKNRTLTIFNLHFESVKKTGPMIDKLADALTDFSEFNQCERLTIEKSNNKSLVKELLKRVDG
jgi:uncharacterized protein YcaQ